MKKNHSQIDLGLNGKSYIYKKIEGSDVQIHKNYATKITNIRDKPIKQTIEDQYVNGLQDQIKYLQLELKLLKDKQLTKQTQFDQLQKFFGDGIPINENILAIKNQFNNYKNNIEKKIKQIGNQKVQRQSLIESLSVRIDQMSKDISLKEKHLRKFLKEQNCRYHELRGKEAALKKQIQFEQDTIKGLKSDNRKIAEIISTINRNKQIQMVANLKQDNHKHTKIIKLKQLLVEKQQQLEQVLNQYQQLKLQQQQKTYVIHIQQDNIALKKKIISLEKQHNSFYTKIQEKKMELQAKLKERHKEIHIKMEMKERLDNEKSTLSKQNSLSIEDIDQYVKERQLVLLKKTIERNKKLSKYTTYYNELLSKVQDSLQSLAEKRPELKSQITIYTKDIAKLSKSIEQERQRDKTLLANIIETSGKSEFLKEQIPKLCDKYGKNQEQNKFLTKQSEKLIEQIHIKQKQLELITILKNLNLQEVQMSKSTNKCIQERLIGFIRSWESLQKH